MTVSEKRMSTFIMYQFSTCTISHDVLTIDTDYNTKTYNSAIEFGNKEISVWRLDHLWYHTRNIVVAIMNVRFPREPGKIKIHML